MIIFEMDTFVCTCRTVEGAMELAKFMEGRFPANAYMNAKALRFNAVLSTDGKIAVYCESPVNEMGKKDFKAAVEEFVAIKKAAMAHKPVPHQVPALHTRSLAKAS